MFTHIFQRVKSFKFPKLSSFSVQNLKIWSLQALAYAKAHWKGIVVTLVIVLPALALANFIFSEPEPEYLTEKVQRGDLTQTVEAVATVISEKDLELKFPVSGVVADLLVSEGDTVVAGQELARLRSGSLQAAVTAARAKLTTASAEYRALAEGTRPEDITIAEAELENKRASLRLAESKYASAVSSLKRAQEKLEALEREARIATAGEVSTAESAIINEISVVQTALGGVENVFEEVTLESIIVQEQPAEYYQLTAYMKQVSIGITSVLKKSSSITDTQEAIARLSEARTVASQGVAAVQQAYDFVSGLEPLGLFDYIKKESLRDALATEKTNAETALKDLTSALKNLQDTDANFRTQIAAEESTVTSAVGTRDQASADINTFKAAVQVAQAQLDLKRAGTRKADIDAAYGRLLSAQADLEKAQADYEDTILRAPIDGTITKVNLKNGEFTPGQFSETLPAMTILGVSPYRIEVFVSEIDIPKVQHGQSGALLLDAYPNRTFDVRVTEIDPAATSIDGVPKYRIKLDFIVDYDNLLKIGMTGDLDIITAVRSDVLYIPGRAVIKNEKGEQIVRILQNNGEALDMPVSIGMETITDVEVTSGLKENDIVIVLIK